MKPRFDPLTVVVNARAQTLVLRDALAARGRCPVIFAPTGAPVEKVVGYVDQPTPAGGAGVRVRFAALASNPDAERVHRGLRGRRQFRFEAEIAPDGRCDLVRLVENKIELAVGPGVKAAAAAVGAAGRRIGGEGGFRIPPRLPPTLDGWKLYGKRAWRLNKPLLRRVITDAALIGGSVYVGSKLAQKAEDEKRERRLRKLAARIDRSITFGTPTLHKIVDETGKVVEVPSVPGVEAAKTGKRILDRHPVLRSALWKAGALAASAGAGAYLGHRLHGRSRKDFLKVGAIGGAAGAALLFQDMRTNEISPEDQEAINRVGVLIEDAAGKQRAGCRETHNITSLAARLGCTVAQVEELIAAGELRGQQLHKGRDSGVRVYASDRLNEIRAELATAAATSDLASAGSEDPDHLAQVAATGIARREREFARRTHTTVELERPRDESGRYQEERSALGRLAKVGLGTAALAGGAAYLRGRMAGATGRPGFRGVIDVTHAGGGQLLRDGQKAAGLVRTAGLGALERLRQRGVRV